MAFSGRNHTPADIDELESAHRILPLLFGCIIPVSILINVPSLTSPWVGQRQYDPLTGSWNDVEIHIPHWMEAMVIVALIMAVICNVCILSRFLERNIWHSVVLSLITASLQDVLSIGAIIPFCMMYSISDGYYYLEGFWAMIASMIFSLAATLLMSIDFHRTPNFRLQGSGVTHKQRMLIAQAMTLCFYLAIGALIMIWIEDWSFLESLFFVMVTITTIGFGDTTPKTSGGRAFVIFYGAGGIVLFAMAINAIRYVILEDLHRQFSIRSKERKAKKDARNRERKEQMILEQERRKRVKEALERVQHLQIEGGNTVNNNNRSHHFSILPRQLTIHGRDNIFTALFSRNTTDSREPKSEGFSNPTLTNEMPSGVGSGKQPRLLEILQQDPSGSMKEDLNDTTSSNDRIDRPITDDISNEGTSEKDAGPLYNHDTAVNKNHMLASVFYHKLRHFCGLQTACSVVIAPPCKTLKEQREADRKLAYHESMEEYRRRLRFSFIMFMSFWLIGAGIFKAIESWSYGEAMYFSFVAFSSIGYGDVVPRTIAGRSIFLVYCLVGIVALTSLASLISEVLSKTMRRHVVEAQMRRGEQFLKLENGQRRRPSDADLEQGNIDGDEHGAEHELSSNDGLREERAQSLHSLIGPAVLKDENAGATSSDQRGCQGSLRNLVQVSRNFDALFQKILNRECQKSEGGQSSTSEFPSVTSTSATQNIYDYLEEADDSDSSYLSPSISQDVTSTIQRQAQTAFKRPFQNIKLGGTYHGPSYSSSPSESRFDIAAWPTAASSTNSTASTNKVKGRLPGTNNQYLAPRLDRQKQQPQQHEDRPQRPASTQDNFASHRRDSKESVTISAVHWQQLVEYSTKIRTLTDSCEETLERFLAWEAREKKKSLRRRQVKDRHKELLEKRKRRLFELGGLYGAIDDGIEDEEELEEELDEWDEEGSIEEDDGVSDETLGQHRERITTALLGTEHSSGNHRRSGYGIRAKRPSITTHRSHQSRMGHIQSESEHHTSIDASTDGSLVTVVPVSTSGHGAHSVLHVRDSRSYRGRSKSPKRELTDGNQSEQPASNL